MCVKDKLLKENSENEDVRLKEFARFIKDNNIGVDTILEALEELYNKRNLELEQKYEKTKFENQFKDTIESEKIKEEINRSKNALIQLGAFKIENMIK